MYSTTATAVLADHDWNGWHPWFLFFPFFWLLFLVIVFVVLRRTVWRRAGCWGPHLAGRQGPLAVLGERYARGEIDEEEYRARRAVISERPGDDRGV